MSSVEDGGEAIKSPYEAGFAACVAEVGRYLTSVDVVPQLSAVLPRLVSHLVSSLQRRRRDSRYATTQVPDHVSHRQGHDTASDCDGRSLAMSQQSSRDDLNFSFLQARLFSLEY